MLFAMHDLHCSMGENVYAVQHCVSMCPTCAVLADTKAMGLNVNA